MPEDGSTIPLDQRSRGEAITRTPEVGPGRRSVAPRLSPERFRPAITSRSELAPDPRLDVRRVEETLRLGILDVRPVLGVRLHLLHRLLVRREARELLQPDDVLS